MSDMPRIFVLNMAKDSHRRTLMQEKADVAGLEIEFFEAINGREAGEEQKKIYHRCKRLKYFGRELLAGEIGCLLSHIAVYDKIIRENIEVAVVFEDDVVFEPDIKDVISALTETGVKWDLLRFLGSEKIYKRGCRKITPLTGRYEIVRLPTTPGGSHGYMIRREAAQRLFDILQKSWMPIDAHLGRSWETGLETLSVYPAPVYPDDQEVSTIGDIRFDKTVRTTGLLRLLFPLNRAIYKFCETIGKKYVYWSSWPRDVLNKKRSHA